MLSRMRRSLACRQPSRRKIDGLGIRESTYDAASSSTALAMDASMHFVLIFSCVCVRERGGGVASRAKRRIHLLTLLLLFASDWWCHMTWVYPTRVDDDTQPPECKSLCVTSVSKYKEKKAPISMFYFIFGLSVLIVCAIGFGDRSPLNARRRNAPVLANLG